MFANNLIFYIYKWDVFIDVRYLDVTRSKASEEYLRKQETLVFLANQFS